MKNLAASKLPVVTAIVALAATAAAGQSPEALPEWLEPDLPPGVDRLCGGPIVPDLPPGVVPAASTASDELPPLPPWCDGTCVIDIAFFYAPEAIGRTRGDFVPDAENPGEPFGPQSVGELRRDIDASILFNNVAWRQAGLDARLRFVGMERDSGLIGLNLLEGSEYVRRSRLPHARSRYGADLVYAITGTSESIGLCGKAYMRRMGTPAGVAASLAVGVVWGGGLVRHGDGFAHFSCLGPGTGTLAHEVGHNLGLGHNIENMTGITPYVPFGRGYRGQRYHRPFKSIMGTGAQSLIPHFSSRDDLYGREIGDAESSDSARALRYTIPDASRYSPIVVPEEREDPHGYGCRPSGSQACLNERRFRVRANYSTPTVSEGPATRLETLGLGDSGSLFYFFNAGNPELLVKVVNGCWLNDHWWVFGSAATDLRYEVSVADLASGDAPLSYAHHGGGVIAGTNGYSTDAGVIADTMALPCGASLAPAPTERGAGDPAPPAAAPAKEAAAATAMDHGCLALPWQSCLNNWRFGASVFYREEESTRLGQSLQLSGLGDSGSLFYFFDSRNPELLVKVVDGCAINGHWWVFGSAATDLEYGVTVSDWATASQKQNPDGTHGRIRFERSNTYLHEGGGRITGFRATEGRKSSVYRTRAGVIADTTAFPCKR